jgi:ribosomal protein L5
LLQSYGKNSVKVASKNGYYLACQTGLEVGTKVTLRGKDAEEIIKKLLPAINNT